ncbi:MAG: 16S rRNA processing protein RimM [Firmicutes bacterium]|jgi:16S rRNA processing protein RimM|nr:16S rRNA processing protein RimM [Bacillota bacterium]
MGANLVVIGTVISSHGLKGEIKVFPQSDFLERCHGLKSVRIKESGGFRIAEVEKARIQGKLWVIKLVGVDSREEADAMKGDNLYILPEERVPLPPGHYYHSEIVGMQVCSEEGNFLGTVKEIVPSAAQDIYVVEKAGGGEFLMPAAKQIVKEIDTRRGRMRVDLPEGLFDL